MQTLSPSNPSAGAADRLRASLRTLSGTPALEPECAGLVYRTGFNLFQQGKHQEAALCFTFLHYFFPAEVRYLKALAAVHRATGAWADALRAYDLAIVLDPADAEASLGAAECQMALGDSAAAETLLALVNLLQLTEASPAVQRRATTLLGLQQGKVLPQ